MKKLINKTGFELKKQLKEKLKYPNNLLKLGNHYDTVVIGAGCSGLYCAYRLHNQHNIQNSTKNQIKSQKIAIFDMLDRIGGRLWTAQFKNSQIPIELGGMRYIQNQHLLFSNLVQQLNMQKLDFGTSQNKLKSEYSKAYLRKFHCGYYEWQTQQQKGNKLKHNYILPEQICGMNSFQIMSHSFYSILMQDYNQKARKAVDQKFQTDKIFVEQNQKGWKNYHIKLTLKDWNIIKPFLMYRKKNYINSSPLPLYKFGFQNIIQDLYDHQAFNFISEQCGYRSYASNSNYMDLVCTFLLDFGQPDYKTLQGGFDMFCYHIANYLLDKQKGIEKFGGGVYLNKQLINIDKEQNKYKLMFQDQKQNLIQVTSNNLILAVPTRSIEILHQKIQFLKKKIDYPFNQSVQNTKNMKSKQPQNLKQLIKSTKSVPAIKMFLKFKEKWWKSQISQSTKDKNINISVTDLPIALSLCFPYQNDNIMLVSFNDSNLTQFWSTLQQNFQEWENKQNNFNVQTEQKWKNVASMSDQVVKQVLNQLRLIYNKKQKDGISEQNVIDGMYKNWSLDPFGGGYHVWVPGYDVQKIMKTIRKPWLDERIFIVGQSFSNLTGWVQGGLQTSEKMLNQHFGLFQYIKDYYKGY